MPYNHAAKYCVQRGMRRPTLDQHFSDSQRHVFTDSVRVRVRKIPCQPTHADPVTGV